MLFHDCPDCAPASASRRGFLAGIGAAEFPRGFDERFKYSIEIRCGSSDDSKYLACRSELLARLSQLITQPFDLGCHARIPGRVLVGWPWPRPLDHFASPSRGRTQRLAPASVSSTGCRRTTL